MEDSNTQKDLKAEIQKAREEIYTKSVENAVTPPAPPVAPVWMTPPPAAQVPVVKEKGNPCGIVGLCIGWFIPLAGLVLGIIALGRKEKTPAFGILSIVIAVFFWIFVWIPYFATH